MNCPKCNGKGVIPMYQLAAAHVEGAMALRLVECDYDGCHAGLVHCCDPISGGNDDLT